MKKTDLFIAAGGTFGHIRPAITVSQELERLGYTVCFFCAKKDRVFPLIKERNNKQTVFLNMQGLPTKKYYFISWFKFILGVIFSLIKTGFLFFKKKPKTVVVSGGFISYPILLWARFLKIPYSILEQNSLPGLVSRLFFKKAQNIFFAMDTLNPEYQKYKQAMIVGNPIQMKECTKESALQYFSMNTLLKDKEFIGVIGGSLGAKALVEWTKKQNSLLENQIIVCITGQKLFEEVKDLKFKNIIFLPFVKDIEYFYTLSDIIISRAGASTISELFFYNKLSIFVPYPFATENHQFYNAQFALQYLKGCLIPQDDLGDYSIKDLIEKSTKDISSKKDAKNLSKALDVIIKKIQETL